MAQRPVANIYVISVLNADGIERIRRAQSDKVLLHGCNAGTNVCEGHCFPIALDPGMYWRRRRMLCAFGEKSNAANGRRWRNRSNEN
jgi:hypothetical protein